MNEEPTMSKYFYPGNVIKSPYGSMWIVTDINDDVISAVSFDSENCLAIQKLEDHERTDMCGCEYRDPYCENCNGTGEVVRKIKGWKHSKILAANVKDFILKGTKRQFGM